MTCAITGVVQTPDGSPLLNARIIFKRLSLTAAIGAVVVVPDYYETVTDGSGNVSITLFPGQYEAKAFGDRVHRFLVGVPDEATATFASLIDQFPPIASNVQAIALAARDAAIAAAAETAADADATAADALATAADALATAADRVATGEDRVAVAAIEARTLRDVATLLANTSIVYGAGAAQVAAGDIMQTRAEGFSYEVAAEAATDQHVTTAGGVKLYVQRASGGVLNVRAFGAVGDGVTDDTAALQAAIAASASFAKMVWPRATYRFTEPLVINGIDVDFQKSVLEYDGAVGSFALTLVSNAGASLSQRNGNRFSDFTLLQEDFTEYDTVTATVAHAPPVLSSFANVTNITPNAYTTTISVPGALIGGYCRATFSTTIDGVVITARVTAPDEVTVYFNNYISAAVTLAAGDIGVTVVNNAYHGLCIGGPLGILSNAKTQGFTGVSFAMGAGVEQTTGVDFSGTSQCYYWDVDINVAPAAGWGAVIKPRNNENNIGIAIFPMNAYGDAIPYRAPCINQVVVSGLTNNFKMLSLECNSSEPSVVLTHASNNITASKSIYYEANAAFAAVPSPAILAETYSSGNIMNFRMLDNTLEDRGIQNRLRVSTANYINGQPQRAPEGGRSLVTNGDFANGITGWTSFGSGSTVTLPGAGFISGQRVRIDVVSGRPNLLQSIHSIQPTLVSNLSGKSFMAGVFIKTNMSSIVLRAGAGNSSRAARTDGVWDYIVQGGRVGSPLDLSIIQATTALQSGYVEIANCVLVLGNEVPASVPLTQPVGSVIYNPPSLADGARASTTVSVPGAALGDYVVAVSFSISLQGLTVSGFVSATDTVTVIFQNNTGGTLDLGPGTLRALVQKV